MRQKSVDPSVWGSSGWHILHRMSFWFDSAMNAYDFYKTLVRLLPCPKCRLAYAKHLLNIKFPLKKKDIPVWVYHLHNSVNRLTGKDTYDTSLMGLRKMYGIPSEKEWIFIASIIESHPGKNSMDNEYLHDLSVFFKYWTASLSITYPGDNVIQSKMSLRKWISKYYSISELQTCSSVYCEI